MRSRCSCRSGRACSERGGAQTMALGNFDIELLVRLKEEGYLEGPLSVIEIGAQQLARTFLEARDRLDHVGLVFGAVPRCPLPTASRTHNVDGEQEDLADDAPAAREFWTWLGFDYASIDIDGSPGSIPLDLNYDSAPSHMVSRYLLVTNFGTTEHVANQLNAFKIIHDLTACGGVMTHHLPMQGMFNHGLVNYNPKFFWMLARSNGYKWLHMDFSFSQSGNMSADVIDFVSAFVPDFPERVRSYCAGDCGLTVVMQKIFDIPYVAALDVATGTRTDNKTLN